ncbi:M14 family zinc carboxypeptidase [Verrucomicrobiota bacterium]
MEKDIIRLITNEPGCLCGEHRIAGNKAFLSTVTENTTRVKGFTFDYNLHFCIGVKNTTSASQDIILYVNCTPADVLPEHKPLLFSSSSLNNQELKPFDCNARTDGLRKYSIHLTLNSQQCIYISNTCCRNYQRIKDRIQVAAEESNARVETIGKTIENEPLTAYCYEKENIAQNKMNILVSSGFHPSEPDSMASIGIMEAMRDISLRKKILEHFNLYIIPVVNPDGFTKGLQGANSMQINFHWKFLGNTATECPEAKALMVFCKKTQPSIYIDFHAYTFQAEKKASPYIKPSCFYCGRQVRELVKKLDNALTQLMDGQSYSTALAYLPTTLPYWLTRQFNTITYAKFHLHLKDGVDTFPSTGWNILKTVINTLKNHKVISSRQILKTPHGNVSRWDPLLLKARILTILQWHLPLHPVVGFIKKLYRNISL